MSEPLTFFTRIISFQGMVSTSDLRAQVELKLNKKRALFHQNLRDSQKFCTNCTNQGHFSEACNTCIKCNLDFKDKCEFCGIKTGYLRPELPPQLEKYFQERLVKVLKHGSCNRPDFKFLKNHFETHDLTDKKISSDMEKTDKNSKSDKDDEVQIVGVKPANQAYNPSLSEPPSKIAPGTMVIPSDMVLSKIADPAGFAAVLARRKKQRYFCTNCSNLGHSDQRCHFCFTCGMMIPNNDIRCRACGQLNGAKRKDLNLMPCEIKFYERRCAEYKFDLPFITEKHAPEVIAARTARKESIINGIKDKLATTKRRLSSETGSSPPKRFNGVKIPDFHSPQFTNTTPQAVAVNTGFNERVGSKLSNIYEADNATTPALASKILDAFILYRGEDQQVKYKMVSSPVLMKFC